MASTPKLVAIFGRDTVARQPMPIRVRVVKRCSPAKTTMAQTTIATCTALTRTPAISKILNA